jgi:hypothetical protein
MFCEIRQHRFNNSFVNPSRSIVIHVNHRHRVVKLGGSSTKACTGLDLVAFVGLCNELSSN